MYMKVNHGAKTSMAKSQVKQITTIVSSATKSSWFIFLLVYLSYCPLVSTFVPHNINYHYSGKDDQSPSSQSHLYQNQIPPISSKNINNTSTTIIIENNSIKNTSLTSSNTNPNTKLKYTRSGSGINLNFPLKLNDNCATDDTTKRIRCQGLHGVKDLPQKLAYFKSVEYAEFVNVSSRANLSLEHLHNLFPNLIHLSINHSPDSLPRIIEKIINSGPGSVQKRNYDLNLNYNSSFVWNSVRYLNFSWNQLKSDFVINSVLDVFPNVALLDVSHNFLVEVNISVHRFPYLKFMDIAANPLDCTSDLYWLEDHNIQLLHPDQTLCDLPPHQNKAKPIWKVIRLIKKVREECKVNCTCDIAYIWEQNHVIRSKTSVNCSNRGFMDFPDPDKLPRPTDTLDLSNNQITSIKKFVEDEGYTELMVMNLYLDSNRIASINLLEGSEWFYNFQVFTIRNNSITDVPVYVLENVFRDNKRILQIDLSMNDFKCDCPTVSSLKIWLLRYSSNIKHIDEVQCAETNEPIRYMKREDWCTIEYEEGEILVDMLDILSVFLALAILLVVGKVYYDYWNFKTNGKLPWIVRKM